MKYGICRKLCQEFWTPAVARNISLGIDRTDQPRLTPYRSASGLLDVKGFSDDLFTKNANLVTVNSSEFRIHVRAEVLRPNDIGNGTSMAVREIDTVVERAAHPSLQGSVRFKILAVY